QEEVAEKLNVTRQTISKWETGESKPDFDKIVPICNLFEITTEELLSGKQAEKKENIKETISNINNKEKQEITRKRAILLSTGIFLYFLSVVSIIVFEEIGLNSIIGVSSFLIICGIATSLIIYQAMVYSKEEKLKEKEQESPRVKLITESVAIIFLIIYFIISFSTMAWHITWIIWLIYAVIENIIKIVFELGGNKDGR
ncbi:MAG: helix-turn-helix transcriptional regulator, partial [Bacilli bacterium]|nr:helix-turn-helix transcriptional regulator [Bacilli bacterium]